jgi:hypothetical protein
MRGLLRCGAARVNVASPEEIPAVDMIGSKLIRLCDDSF